MFLLLVTLVTTVFAVRLIDAFAATAEIPSYNVVLPLKGRNFRVICIQISPHMKKDTNLSLYAYETYVNYSQKHFVVILLRNNLLRYTKLFGM